MAYIVLGMSGGVDSSVAAYLLKKQGHRVLGLFMKNWDDDDDQEYCSARQDWLDCVTVAAKIGIEIEFINFAKEYKDRVFNYFLEEYQNGRTPNPDILCNSEIKFNAFLNHAISLGADYIATGHYADLHHTDDGVYLKKAMDLSKDQSYFLYRLNQNQLSKSMFPLGQIPKSTVRDIAQEIGLHNALKKDSTGICFIGERPFREFLNRYIAHQPGPIFDESGKKIGTHQGLAFYTIGQRKGLNIGGVKDKEQAPWFVAQKNMADNSLLLVQGQHHPLLLKPCLEFMDINWCNPNTENMIIDAENITAKTRYRQHDAACKIKNLNINNKILNAEFTEKQWAITAGQSIVVYQQDICLGGGIIL